MKSIEVPKILSLGRICPEISPKIRHPSEGKPNLRFDSRKAWFRQHIKIIPGSLTVRPWKYTETQKERILFQSHHFSGATLDVNNWRNYQPQPVNAGFLNQQQYDMSFPNKMGLYRADWWCIASRFWHATKLWPIYRSRQPSLLLSLTTEINESDLVWSISSKIESWKKQIPSNYICILINGYWLVDIAIICRWNIILYVYYWAGSHRASYEKSHSTP